MYSVCTWMPLNVTIDSMDIGAMNREMTSNYQQLEAQMCKIRKIRDHIIILVVVYKNYPLRRDNRIQTEI